MPEDFNPHTHDAHRAAAYHLELLAELLDEGAREVEQLRCILHRPFAGADMLLGKHVGYEEAARTARRRAAVLRGEAVPA